ncbi:neurotactin isoform X2 [Zootermopsis nevadensis]|uniref:neurotactin isoform X2 n=1 Tax=Zootermopsis nevadensis TaxID=136037 RepID=UPI000B8E8887|nr:neurotactin isoform X2 [Zootermopsis nevadensis]
MSDTAEVKSEDKKEIEDEEREKMLNEENKRTATGGEEEGEKEEKPQQEVVIKPAKREGEGEVEKMKKALEESEKESGKKKIPIGGIKMPGFLRSRSREKTKDQSGDVSEAGGSTGGEEETGRKTRLLEAIRLPLVSVFPRSKLRSTKDPEIGQQAGLASMETLDDSTGEKTEKLTNGEDGMESVKLDSEEKVDPDKKEESDGKPDWRGRIHSLPKLKMILGGSVIFLILLIIIIAIAPFGSRNEMAPSPIVDEHFKIAYTACGPVEGLVEDGAFAFRGIPYAVSPVRERRWKPAKALDSLESCWVGVLPVHNATPACWQIYSSSRLDGAEDCLTLDVFTPQVPYLNPLPVVVLIGAQSLSGGSPGALQASASLARAQDVVFVRPNFRLGILGFLAAEAIKRDIHPPTSGNYGLSDIVMALKWVQLNIEHFGGDKKSVTLLGHRAGGTLVTALTASRESKGLFKNAWVSSGASILPGKELMESERDNAQFVESLECGEDVECLRNIDAEELLDAVPEPWRHPLQDLPQRDDEGSFAKHQWLVLDGKFLQEHVSDAWKSNGLHANLVMGSTVHADIPPKLRSQNENWTGETVVNYVRSSVVGTKNLTGEALQRYGADWPGLVAMISDIRTVCPLLYLSQSQQGKAIPFYLVNHTRDNPGIGPEKLADVSVDVEAILGLYEPQTPSQERYVRSIQTLFFNFVRYGELMDLESVGGNQVFMIDQGITPFKDTSNCGVWFANDIVPRHGRID